MQQKNGHIECLEYAHTNGCPWDANTCKIAAYNGHIKCLTYAHANGCPWDQQTLINAVTNGHIECLRYAYENGCPRESIDLCDNAALYGRLECLKYLHQQKTPWTSNVCELAVEYNHFDCLYYAHANGCPYRLELRKTIVIKCYFPKWRAGFNCWRIVDFWYNKIYGVLSFAKHGIGRSRDFILFETEF